MFQKVYIVRLALPSLTSIATGNPALFGDYL
jgi:hypothetical protein